VTRALLDTHTLLWWLDGDPRLSTVARDFVAGGNDILVSAATGWEVATKFRLGKLPGAADVALDFSGALRSQGFEGLSVTVEHGVRAGALQGSHKDPFDRMLMAQALTENIPLISNELIFDAYGVLRLW
jgi:PIN domain nuclease of toxin-antitoxin system